MRTKKATRFSRKVDRLLWTAMAVLPILAYFFTYFHHTTPVDFLIYIDAWAFPFVSNIMTDVLTAVGFNDIPIVPLLSYMCGVEIIHLMYDFVVFIPRLTHKLMEVLYNDD